MHVYVLICMCVCICVRFLYVRASILKSGLGPGVEESNVFVGPSVSIWAFFFLRDAL